MSNSINKIVVVSILNGTQQVCPGKVYTVYVTESRLPHTSNFLIVTQQAIDLITLHNLLKYLVNNNLRLMASSFIELWLFIIIKLDVCGSLVLSNSVTY